jgi:hypothetical protein
MLNDKTAIAGIAHTLAFHADSGEGSAAGRAMLREAADKLQEAWELLDKFDESGGQGTPDRQPPAFNRRSLRYYELLMEIWVANQGGLKPPVVSTQPSTYRLIERMVRCGWLRDHRTGTYRRQLEVTRDGEAAIDEFQRQVMKGT